MSATIERIWEIAPHSNKKLEFASVGKFTAPVKKGEFIEGQWCLLITAGCLLPDAPWAKDYPRITTKPIIESLDFLPNTELREGKDVSELLGIQTDI